MTLGLAPATANSILDSLCRNVAWTAPAAVWIKLHTADPGAAGATAAATETTRKQATFATGAAGGTIANTSAVDWTSVAGSEDYTHFSAWTASSAGTFLFSGLVTANAVTTGDNFSVAIGGLTVSLPVAA